MPLKMTQLQVKTKRRRASQARKANRARPKAGFSLVEILISLIVGSIVTLAMTDLMTKALRVSSTTQNEISANAIASELIENMREERYDYLNLNQGTFTNVLVNKDNSAQPGWQIRDEPMLLDFANKTWQPKTRMGQFNGTVTVKIEPLTNLSETLKVTIIVQWSDSVKMGSASNLAGKTITTSTLVTKSGTNYYTL